MFQFLAIMAPVKKHANACIELIHFHHLPIIASFNQHLLKDLAKRDMLSNLRASLPPIGG
jgi:hypothetical protein